MATFNLGSGTELNNLDSMDKVKSYLFTLTEQLRYMFNNLDPQENYSEQARLTLVTDGERQASIEASLNGVLLNYVSKDGIVSAINLSDELIQIEASKIKLEGVVTVNGNFKVGLDGSIEANNGKFSGNIDGSTITGSHIYSSYYGTTADDFYITASGNKTVIGINGFTFEDKLMYSDWIGDVSNPATNGDTAGINGSTGDAGFRKLYLLDDYYIGSGGEMWDVTRTIEWLDNRISALESSGGGGDDDDDDGGGGTTPDPGGDGWDPDNPDGPVT